MRDDSTIRDWLAGHDLTHLVEVFDANGIGTDVLADVTAADLAELGVSLGDRKRVLRAIAATFKPSTMLAESGLPVAAATLEVLPTAAERRQITVLFCDLVGSSQLLGRTDPEESRNIIRNYRAAIAAEVSRFGGHVAQYLGDGILAYFGWPVAYEDAAARAVTAAIEMMPAVNRLSSQHGESLAVRIGMATGLVVVGGSKAKDETEDMTAVGGAVNIAARLQELARPGQIMVAQSTRQHHLSVVRPFSEDFLWSDFRTVLNRVAEALQPRERGLFDDGFGEG